MKRIRFRFSLRWILVLILLCALLCVPEANRTLKQREFALAVARLGGKCTSKPEYQFPSFLQSILGAGYRYSVTDISLRAHVAPVFRSSGAPAIERERLAELFSMSAMKEVKRLDLYGTAFDDQLLAQLKSYPNIVQVDLEHTAVENNPFGTPAPPVPKTNFFLTRSYLRLPSNGLSVLQQLHFAQLNVTRDLPLYTKALHGDANALDQLINLAAGKKRSTMIPVFEVGALAEGEHLNAVVRSKSTNNDVDIRVLAAKIAGARRDLDSLRVFFNDSDADVKIAAIEGLRHTHVDSLANVQELIDELRDIFDDDENKMVRWAIADVLPRFHKASNVIPLLAHALDDDSSFVRAAATRCLGAIEDRNTIPLLKSALGDDDRFVQRHARNALQSMGVQLP